MRRGLTLIELVFSMVIIAIAFSVLPKVLQISAKSANTAIKEEAMYNAVALMGLISALPWDEQNSGYDDILLVDDSKELYECNKSLGSGEKIYRKGGFLGSRNCRNKIKASPIGMDSADIYPDDIDDFDKVSKIATNIYGKRSYAIDVNVSYIEDFVSDPVIFLTTIKPASTNVKYIKLVIKPLKKQKDLGKRLASFWYISSNIGQLQVNKMAWVH